MEQRLPRQPPIVEDLQILSATEEQAAEAAQLQQLIKDVESEYKKGWGRPKVCNNNPSESSTISCVLVAAREREREVKYGAGQAERATSLTMILLFYVTWPRSHWIAHLRFYSRISLTIPPTRLYLNIFLILFFAISLSA